MQDWIFCSLYFHGCVKSIINNMYMYDLHILFSWTKRLYLRNTSTQGNIHVISQIFHLHEYFYSFGKECSYFLHTLASNCSISSASVSNTCPEPPTPAEEDSLIVREKILTNSVRRHTSQNKTLNSYSACQHKLPKIDSPITFEVLNLQDKEYYIWNPQNYL